MIPTGTPVALEVPLINLVLGLSERTVLDDSETAFRSPPAERVYFDGRVVAFLSPGNGLYFDAPDTLPVLLFRISAFLFAAVLFFNPRVYFGDTFLTFAIILTLEPVYLFPILSPWP